MDPEVPRQSPHQGGRPSRRMLRERWDILLMIAAGGALGSLGRWALSAALPHAAGSFPWATWIENITGGLVLGALMVLILDFWPPRRYLRPFLGVGVLGGYTTFSTYMLDTRTLLAAGRLGTAVIYLFGTLLGGLLAVWTGIITTRAVVRGLKGRRQRRHLRQENRAAEESRVTRNSPEQTDHRLP